MSDISGRVFVVHSDLTQLLCDEVLIPTDRGLETDPAWLRLQPWTRADTARLPDGWASGRVRVTGLLDPAVGLPRRRMVNSGGHEAESVEWVLASLQEAVSRAAEELASAGSVTARPLPLLGLPLLGTGRGGYAGRRGEVIDGLLKTCASAAVEHGVDIAVACYSRSDFTAVQARRTRGRPEGLSLASQLGRRSRDAGLALFLGAGISVSAGLPGWRALLERIAGADASTRELPKQWPADSDGLWLAAEQLRQKLGAEAFLAEVEKQLDQPRFALMHALLASLPGREVVSTNFDRLFEAAYAVRGEGMLDVLPYHRGSAPAFLLKLHGDLKEKDVVLDKTALDNFMQDRPALASLLQGLLLTRHLLFVGCSMEDANVRNNVESIAALVAKHEHGTPVGTIVTLTPEQSIQDDWRDRGFDVVSSGKAGDDGPTAARRLEELLDEILLSATFDEGAHLLDPNYAALLSDDERKAAAGIRKAAASVPRESREWEGLRAALLAHGAPLDGGQSE